MSNSHEHWCEHQEVKYCKVCKVVYCVKCGMEWKEQSWIIGWPYYWTTYPNPNITYDPLYTTSGGTQIVYHKH